MPKTPERNRTGVSPIIRFSMHTRPGAGLKTKNPSGVGLKEVRHETPKNERTGRSAMVSFPPMRTRPCVSKNQKKSKSQSGVGHKEVRMRP